MPTAWRRVFVFARRAHAAGDLATARRLFTTLAHERPHDLELRLYAKWLDVGALNRKEHHEELEHLALRALDEHASRALPLCVLGYVALERHELHAARTLFREASASDPTLPDATRGTELVAAAIARQTNLGRFKRIALAAAIATSLAASILALDVWR